MKRHAVDDSFHELAPGLKSSSLVLVYTVHLKRLSPRVYKHNLRIEQLAVRPEKWKIGRPGLEILGIMTVCKEEIC